MLTLHFSEDEAMEKRNFYYKLVLKSAQLLLFQATTVVQNLSMLSHSTFDNLV